MAEPVSASAAFLAAIASTVKVLESSSDLIQGLQATAELLKAQEGLKYNLFTFSIEKNTSSSEQKTASLASSTDNKSKNYSAASKPKEELVKEILFIELMASGPQDDSSFLDSRATFKIIWKSIDSKILGYIKLCSLEGFDTSIGSQAEVNFDGREVEGGLIIFLSGFVNKVGPGFGHFSGSAFFDSGKGSVKMIESNIVPVNSGKIVNDFIYKF